MFFCYSERHEIVTEGVDGCWEAEGSSSLEDKLSLTSHSSLLQKTDFLPVQPVQLDENIKKLPGYPFYYWLSLNCSQSIYTIDILRHCIQRFIQIANKPCPQC